MLGTRTHCAVLQQDRPCNQTESQYIVYSVLTEKKCIFMVYFLFAHTQSTSFVELPLPYVCVAYNLNGEENENAKHLHTNSLTDKHTWKPHEIWNENINENKINSMRWWMSERATRVLSFWERVQNLNHFVKMIQWKFHVITYKLNLHPLNNNSSLFPLPRCASILRVSEKSV